MDRGRVRTIAEELRAPTGDRMDTWVREFSPASALQSGAKVQTEPDQELGKGH